MSLRPAIACGLLATALALLPACTTTLDSLGCTERRYTLDGGTGLDSGSKLGPLLGPASYPNAFRDLLGKSEYEITTKLANTFSQLFHGRADDEAIFVPTGTDQAYIYDVLKNEIRTEGIGLGMLITVELDKRAEFDQLWRYAKANQVADGAAQGYFPSVCLGGPDNCSDPYGFQQIAMALLLARGRWQASPGAIDYGREAADLIDLARKKETYNCGIVDDVTSVFDAKSKLPYNVPIKASAGISRPSIVMPAYYELWRQATNDDFWSQAAAAARAYWQASAHPSTGLVPEMAAFDGTPVPPYENFKPECDRAFINMALDRIWSGSRSQRWIVDESNRVLQFFAGKGLSSYVQQYSLDGTEELASYRDAPLVASNGTLALVATSDLRRDFVNEVWNLPTPTGKTRYYPGIIQMTALLLLSGRMQVY